MPCVLSPYIYIYTYMYDVTNCTSLNIIYIYIYTCNPRFLPAGVFFFLLLSLLTLSILSSHKPATAFVLACTGSAPLFPFFPLSLSVFPFFVFRFPFSRRCGKSTGRLGQWRSRSSSSSGGNFSDFFFLVCCWSGEGGEGARSMPPSMLGFKLAGRQAGSR